MVTKEQILNSEWLYHYNHFSTRLKERYGIYITFEEYRALCREPVERTATVSKNKIKGYITIKGVKVFVGKERCRKRALTTALPFK